MTQAAETIASRMSSASAPDNLLCRRRATWQSR